MGTGLPRKATNVVVPVDEYVRRVLATAPKYSAATRDRIKQLLTPIAS